LHERDLAWSLARVTRHPEVKPWEFLNRHLLSSEKWWAKIFGHSFLFSQVITCLVRPSRHGCSGRASHSDCENGRQDGHLLAETFVPNMAASHLLTATAHDSPVRTISSSHSMIPLRYFISRAGDVPRIKGFLEAAPVTTESRTRVKGVKIQAKVPRCDPQ
jgi:hypothetical protein